MDDPNIYAFYPCMDPNTILNAQWHWPLGNVKFLQWLFLPNNGRRLHFILLTNGNNSMFPFQHHIRITRFHNVLILVIGFLVGLFKQCYVCFPSHLINIALWECFPFLRISFVGYETIIAQHLEKEEHISNIFWKELFIIFLNSYLFFL